MNLPAVVVLELVAHLTRWLLLLRVILVVLAVVLVVHRLGTVLGLTLGLLAVDVVGALGLAELVDLAASETGDELLGELVVNGLAYEEEDTSVGVARSRDRRVKSGVTDPLCAAGPRRPSSRRKRHHQREAHG